eukprot:6209185-Pleurochrysis_carterae.AAC.3
MLAEANKTNVANKKNIPFLLLIAGSGQLSFKLHPCTLTLWNWEPNPKITGRFGKKDLGKEGSVSALVMLLEMLFPKTGA